MLLKISLQLKLSVHQKRHLYSLLGITLTTILIQAIRVRVLDQSWLLMETSVVNPNKKKAVPRNKKQISSTVDFT